MFFELLKRCWYNDNDEIFNKKVNLILTQLTGYYHHH
jgi:hypothetical protein